MIELRVFEGVIELCHNYVLYFKYTVCCGLSVFSPMALKNNNKLAHFYSRTAYFSTASTVVICSDKAFIQSTLVATVLHRLYVSEFAAFSYFVPLRPYTSISRLR